MLASWEMLRLCKGGMIKRLVRAKAEKEWVKLITIAKQFPPFPKPALVKLASEQLL
jgi:hypothetical protein